MRLRLFLAGCLAAVTVKAHVEVDPSMYDEIEAPPVPGSKPADVVYERLPVKTPTPPTPASTLFLETFQGADTEGWQKLQSPKFTGAWAHTVRDRDWVVGDKGLRMESDSAYHGMAKPLNRVFEFNGKEDLFATFEVQQETPVNCGGAYFKLFNTDNVRDNDVANFDEHTLYSVMFGPDKCGYMTSKVHFILKYPTPTEEAGEEVYHEAHLDPPVRLPFGKESHQFGFAVYKDGKVKVWVDGKESSSGEILTAFGANGWENDATIDDPEDFKPADWVDDMMIPDPEATKPEDWDEDAPEFIVDEDAVMPEGWKEDAPAYIENPDAEKPEDWDDEEDGEWLPPKMRNPECYVGCGKWTPPLKSNPEYKGKWEPPLIENPAYQGPWAPRKIPNPKHWKVENPLAVLQPFNALGLELWTVDRGSLLDNFFITSDEAEFLRFIDETFNYKHATELRNLEAETEAAKRQTEIDSDLVDSTPSGFSGSTYAMFGAALLVPLGLVVYGLRSRKPLATASDAAAKKDDDKATETADAPANKENKEAAESDEDNSVPTSATQKPTRQRRKNSSQQQPAE